MREILFRGKRKDNGKWVYGNYAVTDNNEKQQHFIFQNKAFEFEVKSETVGQYTGLTDKNGKKIFEGDILGVTNDDPDYDYITKVYLDCDTLCVDVQGQDYDYTSIGFAIEIWDDECDQVEIIGNIYDNTELLKEKE